MAADNVIPLGAALALVERLMAEAFNRARDPRSEAYKLGARELLSCKAQGIRLVCPYRMGTAEADAFYSGVDEGNSIWRAYLADRQPSARGA